MARTTREGEVFLTEPVEVQIGTVEHADDGSWRSTCGRCEQLISVKDSKKDAVASLEEHFVKDHSTFTG